MFPYEMIAQVEQFNRIAQVGDRLVPLMATNAKGEEFEAGKVQVCQRMRTDGKVVTVTRPIFIQEGEVQFKENNAACFKRGR